MSSYGGAVGHNIKNSVCKLLQGWLWGWHTGSVVVSLFNFAIVSVMISLSVIAIWYLPLLSTTSSEGISHVLTGVCDALAIVFCDAWWRHQIKKIPRYWPYVRRIHRSTINSPHKGQWRGALMFSFILYSINKWIWKMQPDKGWLLFWCSVSVMLK